MIRPFVLINSGSQALSYYLGVLALGLVAAAILDLAQPREIVAWATQVLGITFLTLLSTLIFAALYCWTKVICLSTRVVQRRAWQESGLHAANGIATLGLTYTLFGISLGIGELAGQELTPATVQGVIRSLTERFSLAFLTTVIGLPTSALLRALLSISTSWMAVKYDKTDDNSKTPPSAP